MVLLPLAPLDADVIRASEGRKRRTWRSDEAAPPL